MLAQLTSGERQFSLFVLSVLAFVGLAMAAAGTPTIGAHGFIVLAVCRVPDASVVGVTSIGPSRPRNA